MIRPLGSLSSGLMRIASRAGYTIGQFGTCAVFLSLKTGDAVALTRADPDWDTATKRNAAHLVGVYDTLSDDRYIAQRVLDGLHAHVGARKAS